MTKIVFLKLLCPWTHNSERVLFLHSISHWLIKKNLVRLSQVIHFYIGRKYGCYISPRAVIGKGVIFPHPVGIIIGEGVSVGDKCTIYQGVTLGQGRLLGVVGYPVIKERVAIYSGAIVIGPIIIQEGAKIGAGAVVRNSVGSERTVYGPAHKCLET